MIRNKKPYFDRMSCNTDEVFVPVIRMIRHLMALDEVVHDLLRREAEIKGTENMDGLMQLVVDRMLDYLGVPEDNRTEWDMNHDCQQEEPPNYVICRDWFDERLCVDEDVSPEDALKEIGEVLAQWEKNGELAKRDLFS